MNNFFKKKRPNNIRRPQNITNTKSSPVMRYYRPESESPKITKKISKLNNTQEVSRVKQLTIILLRWSGIIAILAVLFINTTLSSTSVRIPESSKDQITEYRTSQQYTNGAKEIFNSTVINKNKFTLNTTKFESKIKAMYPEVSRASVIIPLAGRKLQVNLQLAIPLTRLQANSNQEAILSENGTVLSLNSPEVINESFASLPLLSIPNIQIEEGVQLLTEDEISIISLLASEFDGSSPKRVTLKTIEFDVQKREMRARFEAMPFYAKLTPERSGREQVGALVATLSQLVSSNNIPKEYIDVRVEDRVFVK